MKKKPAFTCFGCIKPNAKDIKVDKNDDRMRECCVLCSNYFDEKDGKKVIELRCGHVFHEPCFTNWIKGK